MRVALHSWLTLEGEQFARDETDKQQREETLLQMATMGPGQNVQMERLVGMFTDQVRVLPERSRVNLVDVRGAGKPSAFQNDESKNETEIRQSAIADKFARTETRPNKSTGAGGGLTEGESWLLVHNFGRNGQEARRGLRKRLTHWW